MSGDSMSITRRNTTPKGLLYSSFSDVAPAAIRIVAKSTSKPVPYTKLQAAEILSISCTEVDRLVECGELKDCRINRRKRGISLAEINRYTRERISRATQFPHLSLSLLQLNQQK